MREIKFRAWDKNKKEMFMVGSYDFFNKIPTSIIMNDYREDTILMQFTGLKDKNGREIYEGDIVYMPDPEFKESKLWPYKWVVVFEAPLFHLEHKFQGGRATSNMVREPLEVIGNIYEHGHLLKTEEK